MDEIIQNLYDLAIADEVDVDALIDALGCEWDGIGLVQSDSVADLAALMEESLSQG